ncbi:MAG: type II secretion system F family protein, partial [Methanosarcinales archaeon]
METSIDKKINYLFGVCKKLPYVILGERMKKQRDRYHDLRKQLKQARIPTSYEMYLSDAIFYSVLSGLVGAIIGLMISWIVVNFIGLPEIFYIPQNLQWLVQYKNIIISFFITVFITIVLGGIVYALFLVYPSFLANERKTNIDRNLPYAVTFMYALSNGGMNVIDIFKSLSKCESTYGEVSKEVDTIIRDMEYFGHDLRTALHNISELTPSENFQDLIHNLLTVIDSGGSIPKYFQDKAEQFLERTRIEQKGYLETLGLIAESYVTAFVAGPLFIIIIGIMMTIMGSGNLMMLYAIIYMVIPVGSIMFVIMINMMSPSESGTPPLLETPSFLGKEIEIPNSSAEEIDLFKKFIKSRKSVELKKVLKDPLKPIREMPIYSLAISMPLAFIFLTISFITAKDSFTDLDSMINFLGDYIVYTIFIAIIPLAIFHELKAGREKKIQKQIPDFLKKLASTNETGMTLRDSIKLMAKSDIGALSKQIKLIWKDIDWGISVNHALTRFANRIRTHVVTRSMTLLTRANESSGDIGEVLMVAARDAASEQMLKRERFTNMMIYIVIIYISFLVFVGVIYIISSSFLTEMSEAGAKMASSGGASGSGFLGSVDLPLYKRLFYHAALIQGFCSGLIAGVMGEGNVLSGLKHSIIMVTISYLIFKLLVGV